MSAPATTAESDLSAWLSKQPVWLQHAAHPLLRGDTIGADEIMAFAKSAISEVTGKLAPPETAPPVGSLGTHSAGTVSLASLSKISGIGQLNPRNPLNFGPDKIAVVFGSNGSGKSSYVRILKHACGARQKGEIHANVFDGTATPQSCSIVFRDDSGERTAEWNITSGVVPELSTIDIFDTHCGHSYLVAEGQPTYEPRPLVFLSRLAALCDQVGAKLGAAITAKAKALPALPPEHSATNSGKWYGALTAQTGQAIVDANCAWVGDDANELGELAKYLAELSPKDRAKELETKKGFVNGLVSSLTEHCAALSDESCQTLMALRKAAKEKQQTAELAAKVNLHNAVLEGVGAEQWLALWTIARSYSTEVAYPEAEFPNTEEEARCVLCHQELTPEAKKRLQSFEQYVVNEAATAARTAKKNLETAIKALPSLPNDETLEAKGASAGLSEAAVKSLKEFYGLLISRRALLVGENFTEEFGPYPDTSTWIPGAQAVASDYAAKQKQFLEGFNEQERTIKVARQKELSARKWIHDQKTAVEVEIKRLGQVATLDKAKDLCSTRAISFKKGALAEELITPAYIDAFNKELKRLGARTVKVELVKTRVERGAALHQVKLHKAVHNKPIQDVLSEGEHRIVCIAAFLADVSSKPNGSTFVFDDPISSLDLDYEEAVVQRIVELSSTRQIIVFTHRLSLLGMVQDYAKKAGVYSRVIQIRKEPWGAGEPGEESIEAAKPKAVLNDHLPKRIAVAKTVFENEGEAAYRVHAQSICTETRKLVERMIELELLADVIQRHRRAINTLGKLGKLADIQADDCTLLEEMMTKYSRYEHAQSAEAPVELPPPDELLEDVETLKKWRNELEARRK
jgi:energy-coupling factor transporter ATP-binding protein EcfA2